MTSKIALGLATAFLWMGLLSGCNKDTGGAALSTEPAKSGPQAEIDKSNAAAVELETKSPQPSQDTSGESQRPAPQGQ